MNSTVYLLDQAAEKYGDKIGYQDENQSISFSELRKLSMTMGTNILNNSKEEKLRAPIIVFISKSVKCIVSYMAIMYSGRPYVPIDTNMPTARLQKVIDNLKPSHIITNGDEKAKLENVELYGVEILDYDDVCNGEIDKTLIENVIEDVIDTDPIYITYTSGSTGDPKGVTISRKGVIDYAKWLVAEFDFNEKTIMANQAPFYFDNSVFEIYGCLLSGGKMILIPDVLMMFPLKLPEFLQVNHINTIFWVPTVMINVANSGSLSQYKLPELKTVAFCGEIMPNKQLNIWRKENPDCSYTNLYGPTEITDVCAYYKVDREFDDLDPLPIGKACRNKRIIILNEANKIAKTGENGEICVIGSGVGLGYWGEKEKTTEVFIQNPINPYFNETIYKTGDLGYINQEGLIMILGRNDSQIKLRGNRIELGEVENAATAIADVTRACAIFDHKKQEIVLFLETEEEFKLRKVNIELSKYMQKYMLPNKLVTIKKFPHTANDKIDRVLLKKEYIEE